MEPINWTTEKRKVKDLIPFEYNPRILTQERREKLRKSLERFNLAEIPAINKDNIILAGHQRIKVLLDLGRGDETIDVRVPDRLLTELEMKEYNITSNVPVGFWDIDVLESVFSDIDLMELGLDISTIEIPEPDLSFLIEEDEEEFEPTLPEHPTSKQGDLYELKSVFKNITHRVHCGSSTSMDDWKKTMNGQLAQLLLTDPPYNVDYTGGTKKKMKIENDSMSDSDFYNFLFDFYSNVLEVISPGAPFYIFHSDNEGANFRKAMIDSGFKLSQCLIWIKNSMVLGRKDYQQQHEPILYGWKLGAAHTWYSDRKQKTILSFDRPIRNAEHPTMKPLDILEYLIGNSSKRGDIVVDGFLGSGSTLIASEKQWRMCYGNELDTHYCDVIIRRWIQYMTDNDLQYEVYRNGIKLEKNQLDDFTNKD